MATPIVTSAPISSIDLSISTLVMNADIVVQCTMLLLLIASVCCWAIVIDKWRLFRRLKARSKQFETLYYKSTSLSAVLNTVENQTRYPMEAMFVAGMKELREGAGKELATDEEGKKIIRERVSQSIRRARHQHVEGMSKYLFFLATIGAVSPFVGLFGTVWGIMHSFVSIAATKNTTLAVVAPGIAEALFATAMGLLAAIPAVVFYNLFSNQIRFFASKYHQFAEELSMLLGHKV